MAKYRVWASVVVEADSEEEAIDFDYAELENEENDE